LERELKGLTKFIVSGMCILFCFFQIYTAAFGQLPDISQAAVHLFFVYVICFTIYAPSNKGSANKGKIPLYDIALILVVGSSLIYAAINHYNFVAYPYKYGNIDIILAACLILGILEGARRTLTWFLPVFAVLMVIYSLSSGTKFVSLLMYLYHQDLGIWGMLTHLSSTLISMFLIFSSFLLISGGGSTFIEIGKAVGGRYRGGPAKVAVISSGLLGMIVGSPVSNVATTGTYTIPLMKKAGYSPEFAAAVEADASTGGLLVPPVMGAAVFIMAELLNIPYLTICGYAILPALLHYVSIFFFVHFEAMKMNFKEPDDVDRVNLSDILTWSKLGPLVIPIAIFISLLFKGFSVTFCALIASLLTLLIFIFTDLDLSKMKKRLLSLPQIFETAGRKLAKIVPLLISAQLVVSLLSESGLTVTIASYILQLGENFRPLALILSALLCLLLGMGIPPTGSYVLAVAVVSPALLTLGLMPIAIHMFAFTFASFASITPPVCAAVYVASSMAGSNWLKTGFYAVRIALVSFIVPFSYTLFKPYLLGIGPVLLIIVSAISAIFGTCFLASSLSGSFFTGKINIFVRLFFGIGGLLIIIPFDNLLLKIIFITIIALGLLVNKFMPSVSTDYIKQY